ncbi:hypothetical protein OPT61_g5222 [Boeremia exigua]|uniref:Uncharacterized protein n=1 Tax=Boeremia exigua TaxID=749465 RepID=A0ACC2IB09_9PLEO|nr:hypothetical protein OPT61_g5222 [Boeremia exigua]
MTRVRTRIRSEPPPLSRRHHGHTSSNTQRFWGDYIASRTQNGSVLAHPTERDASSQTLEQTAARLRRFAQRYPKVTKTLIAGVPLLLYLYFNHELATTKAAMPSPALDKYNPFPTWMHADPVQVLGLPAAVDLELVPSFIEINRAWNEFQEPWRSQDYKLHGFNSSTEAQQAFKRGEDAYSAFLQFSQDPYCEKNTLPLQLLRQSAGYNDSLPQFANPCRCTYPDYLFGQLAKAVISTIIQRPPPQTEADLAEFCPCTKAIAEASWASFATVVRPPPLARIASRLSSWTLDWRVHQYIRATQRDNQTIPLIHNERDVCLKGNYKGCGVAHGWVYARDLGIDTGLSACEGAVSAPALRHAPKDKAAQEAEKARQMAKNEARAYREKYLSLQQEQARLNASETLPSGPLLIHVML